MSDKRSFSTAQPQLAKKLRVSRSASGARAEGAWQ
jgi:hypothetical protein